MEQPKIQEKIEAIKAEHKYGTHRLYPSMETIANGENLEQIPAKLAEIRKEIDDYKLHLMKQRSEIYNEIVAFLSSKGLPEYEYTGKKRSKKTASYLDAINMKLSEKYRFADYSFSHEMTLIENYVKLALDFEAKKAKQSKEFEEANKRYEAVLKFAEKFLTPEEIGMAKQLKSTTEQIENLVISRYEKVMVGQEIGISCCDECDTYIMGERRCSCGNRRIDAYGEGYHFNGDYCVQITTEPY